MQKGRTLLAGNLLVLLTASLVTTGAGAQVLSELHLGDEDFVTIFNPTGSGIDLAGYTLRIRSSVQGPIDFLLPSGVLEPSASISVTDMQATPGVDLDLGSNLLWTAAADVSIALLDPLGGTRDFVAVGSAVEAPPVGITFVPGAVPLGSFDEQTQSVFRISIAGAAPTFFASDWAIAPRSGPAGGSLTPVPAVPLLDGLARSGLVLALLGAGTIVVGGRPRASRPRA